MKRRIFFAYTSDWNHEIAKFDRGEVPSHRLFGIPELRAMGHEALVCPSPKVAKGWLHKPLIWRMYQALNAAIRQRGIDCVLSVHEAPSLPLLLLKRLGLLRVPVIVFHMGLKQPKNLVGFKRWLWRWLLPSAEALVHQTTMEMKLVPVEFGLPEDRQVLIRMLVDTHFFQLDDTVQKEDYCLAAGTNQGRDYATLMKALPEGVTLKVVTDPYNAAVIEQTRLPGAQVEVFQAVPIDKLKELYRRAKLVINPLADLEWCSGHTVFLENMALGNVVIISDVPGMRDYIEDGVNCIAVKPHDADALREKIEAVLGAPERFAHIGAGAAKWVRENVDARIFAEKLMDTVETVLPGHESVRLDAPAKATTP